MIRNNGTYKGCLNLCKAGEEEIFPFIGKRMGQGGMCTVLRGHPLATELQLRGLDAMFNSIENGALKTLQLKTEQRSSPNIFYELWSNFPIRIGWGCEKDVADLLAWYFYDAKILWLMRFRELRAKLFSRPKVMGFNLNPATFLHADFQERQALKTAQMNDTRGRLVPISWIGSFPAVELHRFRVHHGQLELFDE